MSTYLRSSRRSSCRIHPSTAPLMTFITRISLTTWTSPSWKDSTEPVSDPTRPPLTRHAMHAFLEFSMDVLTMDELFSQSPHSIDVHAGLYSEDSNTDDTNSMHSALPWIGKECTIESNCTEDMTVPASPVLSSVSSSSRSSKGGRSKLSTNDRKLRKKGQNKTAAEKYRQKKRLERDELLERHQQLTKQNQNLKSEVENFTLRLEQFKILFADVLQIPMPTSASS